MLPKQLTQALDTAVEFVHQNVHHDLNPGYRTRILEQMGPLLPFDQMESPTADLSGYARRVTLALTVTRQILPVWLESGSTNPEPQAWLERAEDLFKRTLRHERTAQDSHELSELIPDIASYMEEVILRAWGDSLIGFGYASLTSLCSAYNDECCLPVGAESDEDDEDDDEDYKPIQDLDFPEPSVNYEYRDTAAWAAMVAADGLADWPESKPEKRLAFWQWWLTEAVPRAWETIPDVLQK